MNYNLVIDFIRSLYPNRDFIPLHEPYFGGNEKKYLADCLDSTFVSSVGKYVGIFEEMIRDFTGAKYAIATVNGTAALHVALKLAGAEPGDLVITQPLTFIATCNAISYCGAEPVFVDIDRETLGMSPDSLEAWLSANTVILDGACYYNGVHELHEFHELNKVADRKSRQISEISVISGQKKISACVPMHTFGHPCRIDRIIEVCNKYHIPVVEDSAESIGSYFKGQHTGTFGKLGILSFNGNKTITTGGGGMIITNDDELGPLAKHITTTAKKPHPWNFEHDMVGFNYRMPNVNAALGCAQMERLKDILENKRNTAHVYRDFFSQVAEIEYIPEPSDTISNYWLNVILLKNLEEREEFLKQSNDNKVMTRPAWILMNVLDMFKKSIKADLYVSNEITAKLVNIPSSVRDLL
ncbi:MAG TPA: aminotransferase DegT [Candidatus Cloacimonas sp.]|jgi:dTDP-4-amino-4,6-dideoxygalactose transaminase|nr:aminotransferase DegT [Candidatus Cloacimonas sp.]